MGSDVLAEIYGDYFGSGYDRKLVEYPIIDFQLLKICFQKVFSSVFGSLDPFLLTECIFNRLSDAEHRYWMKSPSARRRATFFKEMSMPYLVEVVSKLVLALLFTVSSINETSKKLDGENLVV